MNNNLMDRLGTMLYSVIEDQSYYKSAKDEHEVYKLLYNFEDKFPSYTGDDLFSAAIKGYMKNWKLHNKKTGVGFKPLFDDYIGDTPVDFGFRITKDI